MIFYTGKFKAVRPEPEISHTTTYEETKGGSLNDKLNKLTLSIKQKKNIPEIAERKSIPLKLRKFVELKL
jgi:hypothetical protein